MKTSTFSSIILTILFSHSISFLSAQDIVIENHKGEPMTIHTRKALPVDAPRVRYPGFKQESTVLKAGSVRREGALPLPCDILLERDVAVRLRDGITIYADIFRPVEDGQYPAILAWSPYGKELGGQMLDDLPGRTGVPLSATSGLEKFEGPDPAYWVAQGYVIINPDKRGAYMSEGNLLYWGHQDSKDGYDVIEWIATQPWSNGKVGMSGNSWLTVSQWFIAAENPPHLAAIAPWEGFSDHYRESGTRGGIPMPEFAESIAQTFSSNNGLLEDQPRMIVDYPFMNSYWEDKKARLEDITVPAYVVASYTNPVHTHGTFQGFRDISSEEKWLRVHNTHEWYDYYHTDNVADLTRFFDRYLKGLDNGWEKTPKVRLSVLNPGGQDMVNRPENEFPLARTNYRKLYLNASNNSLDLSLSESENTISYNSESPSNSVIFRMKTEEPTEITGYMKLRVWVAAMDSEDMDLTVKIEKLSADGKKLTDMQGNEIVATGYIRASMRETDPEKSTEAEPFYPFTHEKKLSPGQVVPLDIEIWPMGLYFNKGEILQLLIGAYEPEKVNLPFGSAKISIPRDSFTFIPGTSAKMVTIGGESSQVADSSQVVPSPSSRNKGEHKIFTGGKYDSYLLVPVIPEQ